MPELELNRLIDAKDYAKMATIPKFVGEISGIRYKLNIIDIKRLKDNDKAQVKS